MEHRRRGECYNRRQRVQRERYCHQRTITNPVGEKAKEDNRNAKAGQPASGDSTQFALREPKLRPPIPQNAASYGKTDAGAPYSTGNTCLLCP